MWYQGKGLLIYASFHFPQIQDEFKLFVVITINKADMNPNHMMQQTNTSALKKT